MNTRIAFIVLIVISFMVSQAYCDLFDEFWGFVNQILPGGNQDDTQNDTNDETGCGFCTVILPCLFQNSDGEWIQGTTGACIAGDCDHCDCWACSIVI